MMETPKSFREPCPDRILDDIGGAFGMGAIGGSVFHFLKGTHNSPKGSRLMGGIQAVTMNAPRLGGRFGIWGGLFSTFDCSMVYLRLKDDPWNSIIAGAATQGLLSMRQGPRMAARSALVGGVLIEGGGIMLNKVLAQPQYMTMEEGMLESTSSPLSWLGDHFVKKNMETQQTSSESERKVLESFDAPSVPSFECK